MGIVVPPNPGQVNPRIAHTPGAGNPETLAHLPLRTGIVAEQLPPRLRLNEGFALPTDGLHHPTETR